MKLMVNAKCQQGKWIYKIVLFNLAAKHWLSSKFLQFQEYAQ